MRVVLTSYGTHGDILPFVGIGKELIAQGHQAVLAASSYYEPLARLHGLEFAPVAPHHADLDRDLGIDHTARQAQAFHPFKGGFKFTAQKLMLPYLDQIFEELDAACVGADLLVAQPTTPWAHMVAHKRQLPWRSVLLQATGLGLMSAQDPAVFLGWPTHTLQRWLGPDRYGKVLAFARKSARKMVAPLDDKARELGIYSEELNPLFERCFSPAGTLALFPKQLLRNPLPTDLPPQVKLDFMGFSYFDGGDATLPEDLQAFLRTGEPPLVFCMGSSVTFKIPDIYKEWSRVCAKLGIRAVFMTADQTLEHDFPRSQIAVPWVSISALLPLCKGVVSAGGIGVCAQAVRAGIPHLIVPFGLDQPDNAYRMTRMGAATTLMPSKARGRSFEKALGDFVFDMHLRAKVQRLQVQVSQTCGSVTAARLIAQTGVGVGTGASQKVA